MLSPSQNFNFHNYSKVKPKEKKGVLFFCFFLFFFVFLFFWFFGFLVFG